MNNPNENLDTQDECMMATQDFDVILADPADFENLRSEEASSQASSANT